MKKLLSFLLIVMCVCTTVRAATFSCGPGYVLANHSKIDGIDAMECQKLWCRDLETNKPMGVGKNANSGYKSTNSPVLLEDSAHNTIECFGERRWCANEPAGVWNPEYGTYMRGDSITYRSYQKGSCFAWRLSEPKCEAGQTAIYDEKSGKWNCSSSNAAANAKVIRSSTMRRTGAARRVIR
ncbi:MAG: hypothetical protein NC311_05510 [Muribaculaceae bacterium]|nr:hypothetical protein [Muribaculaceae bacterium]